MKKGKPTVDEIIELAHYMKDDVYGKRNEAFRLDEELYNLEFKDRLRMPLEFKDDALVLPTGRDAVDTYVNHTDITNARVFVPVRGDSETAKNEAKILRHFGMGVIYMTNTEAEISQWWVAAKHYWLHGMATMKTLWAADLWPDKPVRDEGESDKAYIERLEDWHTQTGRVLPIRVMAVNPANVYPDPDSREPEYVIEINEYEAIKAQLKFPHWRIRDKNVSKLVKQISFWSKDYHIEIVDEEPVLKVRGGVDKHPYNFLPYVVFNSGLGNLSSDGDMAERYVGLLRYMEDLLIAHSASFSVNHVILKKNAWPLKYLQGDNASLAKIEEGFGIHNILPEGVKVIDVAQQVAPQQLMYHFERLHDLIGEHGAPRTMLGQGEQGVRSGSHQRLMMSETDTRLRHAEEAFKNRTAKVLENCAKIAKYVVPGNIRVWSKDATSEFDMVIDTDKIKEPFNFRVQFEPISEEDEYRRQDGYVRMKAAGIYDSTKVWEQMSNVDVDDMQERMEKEKLMNSPSINQAIDIALGVLTQRALTKRLGAANMMAAPPAGQPGQPAQESPSMGRMSPPQAFRATPGSAEDMQNMLRQARGGPTTATQGFGGGGARGFTR